MGYTIGITFTGDLQGWPKGEATSRVQVIVSDYADYLQDQILDDIQWAEVRGGVHGGSRSSESHDHVTVRYTTVTGKMYDAHIAVDGTYGIDYAKCQRWP